MTPATLAAPGAAAGAPEVGELIASGQRLEFAGAAERALRVYGTAAALADTPALRAEAVRRVGDAHRARFAWAEARAAYAESLAIAEGCGLTDLAAEALNATGIVSLLRDDVEAAVPVFRRALEYGPCARVRGLLLQNLGMCAARRGRHADAIAAFLESLACVRAAGYRRGVVMALINVAAAIIEAGDDPAAAAPLLREAATTARDLQDLDLLLLTVQNEAELCTRLGQLADAERLIGEALGHFASGGNESRRAECLIVFGDVHRAHGTPAHDAIAARCYTRAAALAASVGAAGVAARADGARARLGGDPAAGR